MIILNKKALLAFSLAMGLSTACQKDAPAPTAPAKPAPEQKKPEAKKAVPQAPAPGPKKSDDACVGPVSDEPAATIKVGDHVFERKGSTVSLQGTDPDDQFRIGQLSDVKDHTPKNIANIQAFIKWFNTEGVDAVLLNGDLGESQKGIEHVLNTVAEGIKVPVLVFAGNRECKKDFNNAVASAQKTHAHIINMNHIRVFNADDASLVSLPGYYNATYLHCAEGCQYFPEDVADLEKHAAKTTAPARILAAHGPPRMTTPWGLDRIHDGVNVGDQDLANFLAAKKLFPFGLFGNIQEAGGHATNLDGSKKIKEGVYANSLYLNPGPSDPVPWSMLDGTSSIGMAGILMIKGQQATYKIKRLKEGDVKAQ